MALFFTQISQCRELENAVYEADDAVNERAVDNEGERYERGLNGLSFGDRQGSYSPHHQLGRLTDRDTGGKGSVHLSADDRGDASNSKSISRSGRNGHLKFHDREDTTKSRSSDGSRGKGENFDFRGRGDQSGSKSTFSASTKSNRRGGPNNNNNDQLRHKQNGVNTGPEQPVPEEKGPCHDTKCEGLFQMAIPPSCECRCPDPAEQTCPPEKRFDRNICECLCRDINFNCPGSSDFDFDVCNCVCKLQRSDCGPRETLDLNICTCTTSPAPPTNTPPPPPSPPTCSLQCEGPNQYLDRRSCKCQCRRFLIEKTGSNFPYYRRGRSLSQETGFEEELEDELQFRRSPNDWRFDSYRRFNPDRSDSSSHSSKSHSRSGSRSNVKLPQSPAAVYALRCPAGRRVDHKKCVCYW